MITANELRRRNLVYRASDKSIEVVNTIFCNSVCLQGCNDNFYCQEIDPIPLTPEILEKAGFDKGVDNNGNLVVYRKSKYTIAWWGTRWQFWIGTIDLYKSPQYVHQLQNLYHALTGSDLQIIL